MDRSQASIALGEWFSVVVVSLAWMLKHVLQVGDQLPIGTRRDRRLMHVQGTGKGRTDRLQRPGGGRQRHSLPALHQVLELRFMAGDRRQGLGGHRRSLSPLNAGAPRPIWPPIRAKARACGLYVGLLAW